MGSWKMSAALMGAVVVSLLTPDAAAAYGGPGTIVSGIGAFLAVVVAVGAAIFGFFWYPLKKLLRRGRRSAASPGEQPAGPSDHVPS